MQPLEVSTQPKVKAFGIIQVSFKGAEPLTYQWYRCNKVITNDENYSGVKSAQLSIKNKDYILAEYFCVAEDGYGQTLQSETFKYGESIFIHACITQSLCIYLCF